MDIAEHKNITFAVWACLFVALYVVPFWLMERNISNRHDKTGAQILWGMGGAIPMALLSGVIVHFLFGLPSGAVQ